MAEVWKSVIGRCYFLLDLAFLPAIRMPHTIQLAKYQSKRQIATKKSDNHGLLRTAEKLAFTITRIHAEIVHFL